MQPHQYALTAGILWLLTLTILPCLFAKSRYRAYERGFANGKLAHQHTLKLQLQEAKRDQEALRTELAETQQNCARQLDARAANIAELEARIMSYTGMAMTRGDYERLLSTAEALRLAQQVHTALKARAQADRTAELTTAVDELAQRTHAHLRATPSATTLTDAIA